MKTDITPEEKERKPIEIDEEGMKNLVNLFSLLLKIDMRVNPDKYRACNK